MKKTNILLKVTERNGPVRGDKTVEPYCRVKLDANGFPYIIVHNEKFMLAGSDFPRELRVFGDLWATIDECIEGKEELDKVLSNVGLTVDKLTASQLARVG